MSAEDLEKYESEMELQLYREYRDVVGLFSYVVETERRFYLTNSVDVHAAQHRQRRGLVRGDDGRRLGVGHVPAGAVRQERARADVQGRQRRGACAQRARAAEGHLEQPRSGRVVGRIRAAECSLLPTLREPPQAS